MIEKTARPRDFTLSGGRRRRRRRLDRMSWAALLIAVVAMLTGHIVVVAVFAVVSLAIAAYTAHRA